MNGRVVNALDRRDRWIAAVVFGVIAVGGIGLWQALAKEQVERVRAQNAQVVGSLEFRVAATRAAYTSALMRMGARMGRHKHSLHVDEWAADASDFLDTFGGIRTLVLVDASGLVVNSVSRVENSLTGDRFASDPRRAALIADAFAKMDFVASEPLDLRLGGRGALLVVPFHSPDGPAAVVAAVVYADFFGEMFEGLAPGFGIALRVGDELVFDRSATVPRPDTDIVARGFVDATGPDWHFEVWPGPELLTETRGPLPDLVLWLSLIGALLVAIAVRLAGKARRGAAEARSVYERLAAERSVSDAIWRESNDMLCLFDREGRFIRVSDASVSAWGYTPGELEGRIVYEFIDDPDRDRSVQERERVGAGMPTEGFETRVRHKDGGVVHMSWSAYWSEELDAFVAIARNITDRVRREHEIERAVERLRVAVQQTGRAVYDRDIVRGAFEWVGDPQPLLGRSVEALAAMSVTDWYGHLHPDDVESIRAVYESVQATGGSFSVTYRWRLPDDRYVWIEDAGGVNGKHMIGVLTDVNERREFEFELERRVELRTRELALVNRELEAFSYSVSHDLRAPLRAISGFAELLAEEHGGTLGDGGRHFLRRILDGAGRMSLLIDDLLTLGRVSRHDMARQTVDVSGLAGRIVGNLREGSPGRIVDVRIQPGLAVDADPRLVEVVMENLLANAWKFTQQREDARIDVADEDGWLVVRDNGVGFDMAYAQQLYGVFQRLHGAEEFPGTGVGLATVKRVIDRHGGGIRAEAAVGAGAAFFFRFS